MMFFLNYEKYMSRICSRCNADKDLEEFAKRNDRSNWIRSICRKCDAAYARQYRKENAHKHKIAYTNWRIINKDRYLQHKRDHEKERRLSDPELAKKLRERNLAYKKTEAGKACQKKWIRKWYDIWDDVIYMCQKYRILEIIPYKGYKIRKYGPEWIILIRPRRLLEKKKSPTL